MRTGDGARLMDKSQAEAAPADSSPATALKINRGARTLLLGVRLNNADIDQSLLVLGHYEFPHD